MWPIDILSSKLAEMDAEARKVRLKFLAAVHTNAKEKAKVRKQRSKILSISYSRNDLLRIYAMPDYHVNQDSPAFQSSMAPSRLRR